MDKYYRITAYHKEENITAIFDSNGYFNALWEFAVFLREKGFETLSVGKDQNFTFGDMKPVPENTQKIYCRALQKGFAMRENKIVIVNNLKYKEM